MFMRYSQLFAKPSKTAPADAESVNAKYLVQAGFVHQEMAGVYSWLPLGLRVLRKVENIVRDEMNALGAQEILMSALQPKENWLTTNRWDAVDVLFKVPSQTKKEYALGPTHEEIVTPLVKHFVNSYKDLPLAVYQIQSKFRDELRAKSGVLRRKARRVPHAAQRSVLPKASRREISLILASVFPSRSTFRFSLRTVPCSGLLWVVTVLERRGLWGRLSRLYTMIAA